MVKPTILWNLVSVGLLLLGGVGPLAASEPLAGALVGLYDYSGVNRDQTTYAGTVRISELGAGLFWFDWHDTDGSYSGKGALVGETLFIVWGSLEARCSVVFLDVGEDAALSGFWFEAQKRKAGRSEIAGKAIAREPGAGLEGRYSVTAGELSGSHFAQDLEVTALGDDYFRFRWEGDETRVGIGRLEGDQVQIVVSLVPADGQCGKSEMTILGDGRIEGTWMMNDGDFRKRGRETMVRRP